MPVGTPIAPGMKPVHLRPKTPGVSKPDTSPGDKPRGTGRFSPGGEVSPKPKAKKPEVEKKPYASQAGILRYDWSKGELSNDEFRTHIERLRKETSSYSQWRETEEHDIHKYEAFRRQLDALEYDLDFEEANERGEASKILRNELDDLRSQFGKRFVSSESLLEPLPRLDLYARRLSKDDGGMSQLLDDIEGFERQVKDKQKQDVLAGLDPNELATSYQVRYILDQDELEIGEIKGTVHAYSLEDYHLYNGALTNGRDGEIENYQVEIDRLDEAIYSQEPTKHGIKVYRGTIQGELSGASVLNYAGFSSTSTEERIAVSFSRKNIASFSDKPTIYEIEVPKGSHVLDVSAAIGSDRGEEEILLPRNTKYLVESVDIDEYGVQRVKVRAITSDDPRAKVEGDSGKKFADIKAKAVELQDGMDQGALDYRDGIVELDNMIAEIDSLPSDFPHVARAELRDRLSNRRTEYAFHHAEENGNGSQFLDRESREFATMMNQYFEDNREHYDPQKVTEWAEKMIKFSKYLSDREEWNRQYQRFAGYRDSFAQKAKDNNRAKLLDALSKELDEDDLDKLTVSLERVRAVTQGDLAGDEANDLYDKFVARIDELKSKSQIPNVNQKNLVLGLTDDLQSIHYAQRGDDQQLEALDNIIEQASNIENIDERYSILNEAQYLKRNLEFRKLNEEESDEAYQYALDQIDKLNDELKNLDDVTALIRLDQVWEFLGSVQGVDYDVKRERLSRIKKTHARYLDRIANERFDALMGELEVDIESDDPAAIERVAKAATTFVGIPDNYPDKEAAKAKITSLQRRFAAKHGDIEKVYRARERAAAQRTHNATPTKEFDESSKTTLKKYVEQGAFYSTQSSLRSDKPNQDAFDLIEVMDAQEPLENEITIHRGFGTDIDFTRLKSFRDKGFTSASASEFVAYKFASRNEDDGKYKTFMEIKVPPGVKVIDVEKAFGGIGGYASEQEVILPDGVILDIDEVYYRYRGQMVSRNNPNASQVVRVTARVPETK